jgi:hypothetical protein
LEQELGQELEQGLVQMMKIQKELQFFVHHRDKQDYHKVLGHICGVYLC